MPTPHHSPVDRALRPGRQSPVATGAARRPAGRADHVLPDLVGGAPTVRRRRTEAGRTEAGRTEPGWTEAGRVEAGRVEAGRVEAGWAAARRAAAGWAAARRAAAGRAAAGRAAAGWAAARRAAVRRAAAAAWLLAVFGLAGCVTSTGSGAGATGTPVPPLTSRLSGALPAPPPASTAPTSSAAAGTPAGPSVTLLFTGDMLVSDEMRAQAARNAGGRGYNFGPMLQRVAPLIRSADWSICHQETPISPDDKLLSGYPAFSAPYELAQVEKAVGYDACTTASNHTVDHGAAGVRGTLDVFDRVGIRHVGSARTPTEFSSLTIYTVHGLRIGHLAYTYGLNGIQPPNASTVHLIDPARIRADAHRIRAAGAQFVLVSLHFGIEKQQTPSAYQQQVAAAVMASPDVDLVVGHHAHVVQPIQRRPDGRWVVFGLGNFLAQQEVTPPDLTPAHRDGVIVRITVTPGAGGRWRVSRVGYIPTFVNAPTDVVQLAPPFSRARTTAVLTRYHAPIVDDTPH